MENKFILTFLITFLFLTVVSASISSVDCWGTMKLGDNISLIQVCPSCSYVNVTSITYQTGQTVLLNQLMDKNGTFFSYDLENITDTGILTYVVIGDKDGATPPLTETLCIEISRSGKSTDKGIDNSLIYIAIMGSFILLILVFYYSTHEINFDSWEKKLIKKYETKNFVKLVLGVLGFAVLKNSFIVYYLLGLPILLSLLGLAFIYDVFVVYDLVLALVVVYLVGILLVGLIFLSYVQEWAVHMLDLIKESDWGF